MTPNKLSKIEEIYHAVLEIAPEKRPAFLTNACGDDNEILVKLNLSFLCRTCLKFDRHPAD